MSLHQNKNGVEVLQDSRFKVFLKGTVYFTEELRLENSGLFSVHNSNKVTFR